MKKRKYNRIIFILLVIISIFMYGCFGVNNDFRNLRNEIFRILKAENVDKEFEYSVSKFGVFLASKIAGLSDGMIDAEMVLEKISGVQIGVYNLEYNISFYSDSIITLDKIMRNKGWINLVKDCSHNQSVIVYVNTESNDRIKDILILNIDSDQLVMVEIHGRLEKLIDMIIRKRGIGV